MPLRFMTPSFAVWAATALLPVVAVCAGFGVVTVIVATVVLQAGAAFARLAQGLQAKPGLVLEGISASHYVEKVRWALDTLGVEYTEARDVGLLGVLLLGRSVPRLQVDGRFVISNSSDILRYLWGRHGADRGEFLKPTKEIVAFENKLDTVLGRECRVWCYYNILPNPKLGKKVWGIHDTTIPKWQRLLLDVAYPVLRAAIKKLLNVTEKRAALGLQRTKEIFDEVEEMLSDGRPYLFGQQLTLADITFCSLAAIVIFPGPELYGRGTVATVIPRVEELPAAMKKEVNAFRERPAGQFVRRLYAEAREIL
eukprot:m.206408 g.206408  ORF g.206408 m.206408 type:complete len:311 (+) comp18500_c1_seq4:2113-3045(+)